jgi:two-component system copper resistance phosphate regulon response regulator CusR
MRPRVLVVEDEFKVADALKRGLEAEQYDVVVEMSGDSGRSRVLSDHFDLIVLDRMLHGCDGLEVLGAARTRRKHVPVLMLTARDAVEDRVQCLDAGADDYMVKPFAFVELLARMRVLLRHPRPQTPTCLATRQVRLDLITREATRDGRPLQLTRQEFDVLALLLRHVGQHVSRDMIVDACWNGYERTLWLDNAIDVHVGRLRKKVDVDSNVKLIETIRGVGYSLREPPTSN